MLQAAAVILAAMWLTMFMPIRAFPGHELPYYPSYYPQEIRLESLDLTSAAPLLQKSAIQAYIGGDPFPDGKTPANVGAAESLGAYLVVTFNAASDLLRDRERRCTAARQILAALAGHTEAYRFHPYPVTPYHMDYLYHVDALEALKQAYRARSTERDSAAGLSLRMKANGQLAARLLQPGWQATGNDWDVTIEAIDVSALMAGTVNHMNGWMGPLWLKEGWFHAHRLLADHLTDDTAKQTAEAIYRRLVNGHYDGLEERLNLERKLVSSLTQGCERVVAGYTVKHEYFSTEYSAGIENIAYDAHAGLNSAIFIRTAKLKDFPWNGWLTLGMNGKPSAAWNPIGGFTDEAGRLIWFTVGDPAFLPAPHNGSWMANRFTPNIAIQGSTPGGMRLPRDAWIPEPATGVFTAVGEGKTGQVKITYRGLLSAFHDGTQMTVADLLYPYSLAFRWGTRQPPNGSAYDPSIAASTALMRQKLAGVRVVSVEQEPKAFGELQLTQVLPVIEVYLNDTSPDFPHLAAIAPPWSTLPWQVIVLMEEAVKRGLAAFSADEAKRRRVPWLDLVRDQRLKDLLASLVADFEVRGYRPEPLQDLVTEAEARQRWDALKSFYLARGHFLVTNGPYRLEKWSENAVVLEVFRDLSYPLGIGSYDKYAYPPKASISKLQLRRHRVEIAAEMEKVEKAQRTYNVAKVPLNNQSLVGVYRVRPVVKYIVLSPQGDVVKAGDGYYAGDGIFTIEPLGKMPPGHYTVLTTMYLNDNYIEPDVRLIPYPIEQ
jgi:hypothetical protein